MKEHQRDARSFRWLDGSWLDFKLGVRLLIKYPGLTLVGGLAISFAIAIGAGVFQFLTLMVNPTLPLDEGDRVVGIRLWHAASSSVEERASHDFLTWRQQVRSIEDLGAFRTVDHNLIVPDGRTEPVRAAEISAAAFRLARVSPLFGRALVDADEQTAAAAVVVIGYGVWQTRFGGDPAVLGQTVRLGSVPSTVVGVMPERFAFPVSHDLWAPLRLNTLNHERRQGPDIQVFGRLARGVTLAAAQAELTTIGLRAATDFPDTHEHLRPEVMPYVQSLSSQSWVESAALRSVNVVLVMLLVLAGGNVALLMFARAATRESEIAVRNALGASRGRIVLQLFVEAVVLAIVAAASGLSAVRFLLRWWLAVHEIDVGRLPFWFTDSLAPTTVLYAVGLAVLGAVIAGVVPALKVTGRNLEARLRQASAGGGGLQFGGLWTAVIVCQVALTVAAPATAFFVRRQVVQKQSFDVGFPASEYLSGRLEMDRELPPGLSAGDARAELLARFRATYHELEQRLASEAAVAGVTFTDRLPRTVHPHRWLELDGDAVLPASARLHRVSVASVGVNYFDVLRAPILLGRAFHSSDSEAVIVNESFVARALGGRNPIGRRVHYVRTPNEAGTQDREQGSWHEIVGVVRDLGTIHDDPSDLAGVYHAVAPGAAYPVHIAVHVRGKAESFASHLRAVAAEVDPTLRLDQLMSLDQVGASMWNEFDFLFRLLVMISAIALLLSLAGIYSVMSFTVSRRTREIGIRVALGGRPRLIVLAILRRPLTQVGLGVVAGAGLTAALAFGAFGGDVWPTGGALVMAYATLMMAVCVLACVVPMRRALHVQPTEALRAE